VDPRTQNCRSLGVLCGWRRHSRWRQSRGSKEVLIYIFVYTCIHFCTCLYIFIHLFTYIFIMCIYENMQMYAYMYTNIYIYIHIHPKILFEIAMALLTISVSFPSKPRFSATFSILLRFGESWNPTNCEKFNADGSLMGRTNLCGKNNVRNCDLLQSDFFARCRTVLGIDPLTNK